MNKRRKKYSELRSMEQLLKERTKLAAKIRKNEIDLLDDCEEVKEFFSFSNLADFALGKLMEAFPISESIMAGYKLASSLVHNIKDRRRPCKR